ncbi:hypothetical protein H0H92_005757 [Tricholoma furcatifolium]|nr:hypothetical protein H0H92_005757 [Tricholoma furcatifolium]
MGNDKSEKEGYDKYKEVAHHGVPGVPPPAYGEYSSPPFIPPGFEVNRVSFPTPNHSTSSTSPGAIPAFPTVQTNAPPSGYRIPLTTSAPFPDATVTGQPVGFDLDGVSPVFIGSALFQDSVHPCKIGPHLQPFALVPYAGKEYGHHGRFDLLPFDPRTMEWVSASHGKIPPGRQPIEGGYEANGTKLYHALALLNRIKVPGKTGEHLGACNVSFGGSEHAVTEYEIL